MKSLKTKVLTIICVLLILTCTILGILSYEFSANALTAEIGDELQRLATMGADKVQKSLEVQWNSLEVIASNEKVQDWENNWEEVSKILASEKERSGALDIAIADVEGDTIAPSGDTSNVKDTPCFQSALSGNRAVSDPSVSKLDSKSIVMAFGVPIKKDGEIVGVLLAIRDGYYLSEITNSISYTDGSTNYMINKDGTTVAHAMKDSVLNMDNMIEAGKEESSLKDVAKIQSKMIQEGIGSGSYVYDKITYCTGFANVPGTNWIFSINAPKSIVWERLDTLKTSVLGVAILILLLSIVAGYIFSGYLTKPIIMISNHLKIISSGDFRGVLPSNILKKKDEIGVLAISTDTMQKSIKEIIKGVLDEANNVSDLSKTEENSMASLTEKVTDVSSVTEEISAGMEETAATIQEMTATSAEIEVAIQTIASKANEGLTTAMEISERAKTLKDNAIQSQKNATVIYKDTETALKSAIDQSKAVHQINALSDAILQITTQTNLLSLNASIEAARAGEAGKGFAVVADEIRKLAENSKNTVGEIQKVTQLVVDSVQNLSDNSMKILHFIDSQVVKDYETLVMTGEQYDKDAVIVNEIVTDLSATSEELEASIVNMIKAMNEIAVSSSEGAEGTQHIADRSSNIAYNAKEVLDCAQKAYQSTERLVGLVTKFNI